MRCYTCFFEVWRCSTVLRACFVVLPQMGFGAYWGFGRKESVLSWSFRPFCTPRVVLLVPSPDVRSPGRGTAIVLAVDQVGLFSQIGFVTEHPALSTILFGGARLNRVVVLSRVPQGDGPSANPEEETGK